MTQKSDGDWRFGPEFPRFLGDLIAAELARMRPGSRPVRLSNEADLGADSLEHLRLALAVTTALGCARPDRPDRLQDMRTFGQWVAEARRIAEGSDAGLAFKTSGSTGEPCFVAQEFAALAQETEALAEIFSGATRIIALVPAHHIYGFLFTVILPGRLRLPVFDGRAQAMLRLVYEVIGEVKASEEAVTAATAYFVPQEIVEIILTTGFYMTMARMTETLRVDVDAPPGVVVPTWERVE